MTEFFTHFHFLRPLFLLGLLALPLLAWILKRKHDENNDWSNAIAPELLAHLMPERKTVRGNRSSLALLVAIALTFIALSGPTWEKKPLPVVQIKDDVVVILDLSISMLATDIAPNRLTRAKQKLQDLLAMRNEGNTALIAFSGDSHIVTPLSDDSNTLLANLPALDPFMMPVIGSRPDLAVEQAIDILERGKANRGRIVLITDGVEAHQAERIETALPKDRYTLSILAVGTAPGAPIDLGERGYLKDNGNVVIPKTDINMLSQLAKTNGGQFSELELTDTDLNRLDIDGSRYLNEIEEDNESAIDKRFDAWEDLGYWLLVAVIPLLLFSHRQGALLIALFVLWPHDSVLAVEKESQVQTIEPSMWDDLWLTRDQQAQALMNENRYAEAATLFESPEHKAEALYRAQKYAEAAAVPPNETTSRSEYNRGNALAKAQKLEEALEAYEKALAADPSNEDARFNKKLVEDLLAQQQEQQDQNQQDGEQNSDEQESKGDNSSQDSEGSQEKGDQESDDEQRQNSDPSDENSEGDKNSDSSEQQSESSKEQEEKSEQNQQDQNNAEQEQEQTEENQTAQSDKDSDQAQDESSAGAPSRAQELDNLSDEEKQSFEQWMRRVPDDPGALLRRKFEQQSRERNQQAREKGEPLW